MVDTFDLNGFFIVRQGDATKALDIFRSNGFFSKVFPAFLANTEEPTILIGIRSEDLDQERELLSKASIDIIDSGKLNENILRGFYENTGN